jgi:hypothetical protein
VDQEMGEIASLDGGHSFFLQSRLAMRFALAFALRGGPVNEAETTARALYAQITADTHPKDVLEATQAVDSDFKAGRPALIAFANRFSWVSGVAIILVLAGFYTALAASIYFMFPFTTFFAGLLALILLYLIFDSL